MTTPNQLSIQGSYGFQFNEAYVLNKPPIFYPFYNGTPWGQSPNATQFTQQQRWAYFQMLLSMGYTLDEEIEGEAFDPYSVMYMRSIYGDTYVDPGQGNVSGGPTEPQTINTGTPPAGTIPVTLALLPPYVAPAAPVVPPVPPPPVTAPVASPVVPSVIIWGTPPTFQGAEFKAAANDGWNPGQTWTGTVVVAGVTFTGSFEKISNLFYLSWVFTPATSVA